MIREFPGFKKVVRSGIVLETGSRRALNLLALSAKEGANGIWRNRQPGMRYRHLQLAMEMGFDFSNRSIHRLCVDSHRSCCG